MEFFRTDSHIDFLGARWVAATISLILVLGSIALLHFKGIHWGLDFTGGTVIEIHYPQSVDTDPLRETLKKGGYGDAVLQHYGSNQNILIRLPLTEGTDEHALSAKVFAVLQAADPSAQLVRTELVGAQIGSELATQGAMAVLVGWLGTMLYVALRFEWRFAVGAALALAHDPLLILGMFSLFQFEFDLPTLAGILAVIGYSLNDTIVVFDRVRENFIHLRQTDPYMIMNLSLNQTLSRTIMTSVMTLLVVVALLIYGGPTLFGFSLALCVGIVVGTYSSIYVAGSLSLAMGLKRENLLPPAKEENRTA
ncbi:MAG: protein translocase subunit SecF [Gammaproteobacteria bacterium]